MVLVVKTLPANAGGMRDSGLILGSGRAPGEGLATHSSILTWRIPWSEGLVGYSPSNHTESDTTEST